MMPYGGEFIDMEAPALDHLPWCTTETQAGDCNCDDFDPCMYCHLVGNCICP